MNNQSLIYNFLLDPRFRIWRHLFLLFFFILVSINQSLTYGNIPNLLGDDIYWITALTFVVFIVVFYLSLWLLIPKYLLTGQYARLTLCIIVNALIFTSVSNIIYLSYNKDYSFFSKENLVDTISAFSIYILCISGVIIPVFIKNWITSNQRLNQLKNKQKSSQIEQLKEQINPSSFFKILNRSALLVKPDPTKASAMLMKLSQLLRYQLYDCNRSQVLLTAEISFLKNFLDLESLYSSKLKYTVHTNGDINGIFISPSILLPYILSAVNSFSPKTDSQKIDIHISNHNNSISIILKIQGIDDIATLEKEFLNLRDRLNTLYADHYMLAINDDISTEEIEVGLTLEKNII